MPAFAGMSIPAVIFVSLTLARRSDWPMRTLNFDICLLSFDFMKSFIHFSYLKNIPAQAGTEAKRKSPKAIHCFSVLFP